MENDKIKIGEIIGIGLLKKKMKVKELAEKLGVGSTAVSQWLHGNSTPPGDKMIKIIEILDLVDEFFPKSKDYVSVNINDANNLMNRIASVESNHDELNSKLDSIEKGVDELASLVEKITGKKPE